jgi:hypothetical protein
MSVSHELSSCPQEVDRHDERIMDRLITAPVYKKHSEVRAQIADGGEVVETRLADGSVETRNVAKPGDAIVTNPGGERYIIRAEKFGKRYKPKIGDDCQLVDGVFTAIGFHRVIDNPFGSPITMLASWGEMQYGQVDCKLADAYEPATKALDGDPYIIGRKEFAQTYKPAEPELQIPAVRPQPKP